MALLANSVSRITINSINFSVCLTFRNSTISKLRIHVSIFFSNFTTSCEKFLSSMEMTGKDCKSLFYLFFHVESQVACRPRGKLVEDKILCHFSPFLFSRRWLFSRHNRSDLRFLSFRGIFSFKARHSAAWLGCLAKESSGTILPIPCHANSRIRGTMRFTFVLGQFGELGGCKRFSFFPSLFCFLRLNGDRNLFAKLSWRWLQRKLGLWIARRQLAIIFLIPVVSNKQKVSFSDFSSSDVQICPDISRYTAILVSRCSRNLVPDPSFQLLYAACDVATRKRIGAKKERRASATGKSTAEKGTMFPSNEY